MGAQEFILSVLVNNETGVLTRVSGLFARRGFNIDSLSVGETENPEFSRITIRAKGDERIKQQIVQQLRKLHDVRAVELMDPERIVVREMMLIKIQTSHEERLHIQEAVRVFRAKIVDLAPSSITVELTGEKTKLDGFLAFLAPYRILELCRTGTTAIGRGEYILSTEHEYPRLSQTV